ncbi:hypothetical protein [Actinomadura macrotermitis]|uniref:Uncharacterized protein n=1 Tax=Actinomadura macrotermitis TaxID=2585200 RepID=A0A7K0C092_9ACTN|nr:hypothetical protein [Actinomadura macrotermitis]MQY06857.1 hypothetical protein [Actinomadura macrotermitis]
MAQAEESRSGVIPAVLKEMKDNPATLIVGFVSAVAGVLALSKGRQLLALACVAVVLVWLLPFAPWVKDRRVLRLVLPGVLTLTVVVAAALTALDRPRPSGPAFEAVDGPVPPCAAFRGKGAIPADKKLLVFDRQVSKNGMPVGSGKYYFDGPATPVKDGWAVYDVQIGGSEVDYDFYVEVTAGLVDAHTADRYISDHRDVKSRLDVPLPAFDAGSRTSVRVVRNRQKGTC